jgi:ribosomal protein L2
MEVEKVIAERHAERAANAGRAQWRVIGTTFRGTPLVVVYDHPHAADSSTARVVTAWPL